MQKYTIANIRTTGFWCLSPPSINFNYIVGQVLLVEETGMTRKNHGPAASHWEALSINVVSPGRYSNSQR
jgi:hypothetical protein